MKIFKLALLFILCVVVLVVALYVPRFFKNDKYFDSSYSTSTVEPIAAIDQNENANIMQQEEVSEEKVATPESIDNNENRNEESTEIPATSKNSKVIHEDKETPLSKEEALARHMEQKKSWKTDLCHCSIAGNIKMVKMHVKENGLSISIMWM